MGLVLAALLDLLLPSLCPCCREAEGPRLCAGCVAALPRLEHPCPWCAAPRRSVDATCRACGGAGLVRLRGVAVACHYRGVVEDLVHLAKAAGRPAAVRALAELAPSPPEPIGDAVVTPIPPAPGRRHGPHLATAAARAIAHRHGLPLRRLLRPTRHAAEQHRLGAAARARNVEGLFVARGPVPARVVLVDDLLTSGATAMAAARALADAGATDITLVCIARTPRSEDAAAGPPDR